MFTIPKWVVWKLCEAHCRLSRCVQIWLQSQSEMIYRGVPKIVDTHNIDGLQWKILFRGTPILGDHHMFQKWLMGLNVTINNQNITNHVEIIEPSQIVKMIEPSKIGLLPGKLVSVTVGYWNSSLNDVTWLAPSSRDPPRIFFPRKLDPLKAKRLWALAVPWLGNLQVSIKIGENPGKIMGNYNGFPMGFFYWTPEWNWRFLLVVS